MKNDTGPLLSSRRPPVFALVGHFRPLAGNRGDMPPFDPPPPEEMKGLLARARVIQSPCDLDLLAFLYRHPRILLTSENLAAFVGYPLKDIATSLDTFIEAGLLGRTAQQSEHAARMFLLLLDGSQGGGVRTLLQMASTRQGRLGVLDFLIGSGADAA